MSPIHNDRIHRLHLIPILVGICAIGLIPLIIYLHGKYSDSPGKYVQQIIDESAQETIKFDDVTVDASPLRRFYENNGFDAVWYDKNVLKMDARFLVRVIQLSEKEGFNPDDYYLDAIARRFKTTTLKQSAELELLLTSAFFKFATHLRNGRIASDVADHIWPQHPVYLKPDELLSDALHHNALFTDLFAQNPPHSQYMKLKKVLTKLQEIQEKGGWPTLPRDQVIKPGMQDGRIVALRRRLKLAGDLPNEAPDNASYDDELKNAVISFQRRHGILADGILGADTIETLNVSVEDRISQVILNLERWRLMPRELGYRYILVNASGYELVAVKEGEPDLNMRIIVGADDLQTPIFSSAINRIVVNPEWHVPRGIAIKELLPKQLKNHSYLKSNNYRLTIGTDGRDVDVDSVDWSKVNAGYFPYELHQRAGRHNPLGKMKFVIPNEHDVYLHDTNNRSLFNNVIRDLSHGCIRLEFPMKLANFVLKADSTWTESKINELINSGQTVEIKVNDRVPVHIVYFTVWVDDDGKISFYKDIYNHDKNLREALGMTKNKVAKLSAMPLKKS